MSHPAGAVALHKERGWLPCVVRCLAVLIATLALAGPAAAADLNATPSTLASVYASAQGGDVIHLAAGNYGTFTGGSKSSVVTLVAQPGAVATISPNLGAGVNNLRFDGLTIAGAYTNGARNVAFVNSRFTGLVRVDTPANVSNANILFDHDTFDGIDATATSYEGRLTVRGYDNSSPVGVKITNSHFGNGGGSDGVQIIGGAYGVEIGPGNEFSGLRQGAYAAHVDSIQLYGSSHTQIVGNYFHDDDTIIMAPDGGESEYIADNVMIGGGYVPAVQLGSHDGTQFVHNTVKDILVATGSKSGAPAGRGVLIEDNVFAQGASTSPAGGSGCSGCVVTNNLFATNGNASGTNAIIGTPVFTGGSNPTTYAGYQLAGNSPGRGNGSDGNDLGARVGGTTPPPPDTQAPDTTITSGPTDTTNDATPTFAFTASEEGSVFECRVDSGSWADCATPWTTATLADGVHSVAVRATDDAGNTDPSPATRAFTVSTGPPPDTTAPDTTITAGPTGTTDNATPTFAFTASEAGSVYECRVDAAPWADCASPWTTAALSDGPHTVSVRATDTAGNTDASPATRAFTVDAASPPDTSAPQTSITSGPTGTTSASTASFAFSSSEPGSTFECRLDGGAFAACTSPEAYSGLAAGAHTFSVRATDAAGNSDASPATQSWTIQGAPPADDHEPVAAFTASPAAPAIGQAVAFDASGSTCEDAPCEYTWEDDGPDGVGGKQWPLGDGETMSFTFQGAGAKYVRVTVTDADGDADSTRKTVTVASSPAPDSTAPDTTIASGPSDTTDDATPTVAFASSEPGSSFECRVDSGVWAACTSPWTTDALGDGAHTVSVRATDAAGNTDASPATRAFTVAAGPPADATGPDTTISSGPDAVTNDNTPTFVLAATEIGSTFSCQVDAGQAAACTSPWTTSPLADGSHRVEVAATDPAGNADVSPATRSFRVDTQPPETTIESAPPAYSSESSATLTFDANEPEVSFECRLDWRAWADCTSPQTYAELAVGRHWASVRATDAAGNVDASPDWARWTTVAP
jgi:Bacterial Ig-like domain/PKD domain